MWIKNDGYARGLLHWNESYVRHITVDGEPVSASSPHHADEQRYVILGPTMRSGQLEIVPRFSEAAIIFPPTIALYRRLIVRDRGFVDASTFVAD